MYPSDKFSGWWRHLYESGMTVNRDKTRNTCLSSEKLNLVQGKIIYHFPYQNFENCSRCFLWQISEYTYKDLINYRWYKSLRSGNCLIFYFCFFLLNKLKKVLVFVEIFDFRFFVDFHILGCPENGFTISEICLYVCLCV